MRYLIPSYRRAETIATVDTLIGYEASPRDIVVGVQTDDDLRKYQDTVGSKCIVLRVNAKNAAENRNSLISQLGYGERAVVLDDDIRGFQKAEKVGKGIYSARTLDGREFNKMLADGFSKLGSSGAVWGIQTTTNIVMVGRQLNGGKVSRNKMLTRVFGTFGGSGFRFDGSVRVGEDYEACLNVISSGMDTVKLLEYMPVVPKNGTNKGGCHGLYGSDVQWHKWLVEDVVSRYPHMVRFINKKKDCKTLMVTGV